MNVWSTTVAGLTVRDIRNAAEDAAASFFDGSAYHAFIQYRITGHPIETSSYGGGPVMTQTHYTAEVEVRW